MLEPIKSIQIILTLIATGILFGLGLWLVQKAIDWPVDRIAGAAAIICVLLVIIAWLV
jgi:hypothetical protein